MLWRSTQIQRGIFLGSARSRPANFTRTRDAGRPPGRRSAATEANQHARQNAFGATRTDATLRTAREYGGALGPAALLIYNLLVFKYYNLETGRCDPSLERMAADSGYSRASVAEAIAELERRGMIRHHRRVYQKETRPGARWEYAQDTNAYTLVKPERWRGYTVAPPRTPPVDGDTVGAPEPVEDTRTPEDKAGDDAAGIAAQAKQTLEIWAPAAEGSSADLARALLSAARTRLEQLRTKER